MIFHRSSKCIEQGTPSRQLPSNYKMNTLFTTGGIWFGLVFFLAGLIPAVWTFPQLNWSDGPDQTFVKGQLVNKAYEHVKENRVELYRYDYSYAVKGQKYTGTSYGARKDWENGAVINIAYDENEPAVSRIEGMRMKLHAPWLLLLFSVFIAVGGGIAYFAFREFENKMNYVRHGLLTEAVVDDVRRIEKNGSLSFKVRVSFVTATGEQATASIATSNVRRMSVDEKEMIVYLPWNPKAANFLLALPVEARSLLKKSSYN